MSIEKELTPREIVKELDKYIIGQNKAKKSVAIALRNRYRRERVSEEIKDEIIPKNILMIGPTGVGKTEIARRLARLANAPFIKVEATKFTEVGYVGRDVESMVRDLMETAMQMVKKTQMELVKEKAEKITVDRIVDIMQPKPRSRATKVPAFAAAQTAEAASFGTTTDSANADEEENNDNQIERIRERLRKQIIEGKLDEKQIDIDIEEQKFPVIEIFAGAGIEEMGANIQEFFGQMMPKKQKRKKVTIKEAKEILVKQEMERLVDMDAVIKDAKQLTEEKGIIFIDELDKIAGAEKGSGPDVSREGVQRDLLPIIEGSTVMSKYGPLKTDHILFISAGAFHSSKPSDLIPELQGRFPIRVELDTLTKDDFKKILLEPKNALTKQYIELLKTEEIDIIFSEDSIEEIADTAFKVNEQTENIGARRLHTVIEKIVEEISFTAPDIKPAKIVIDKNYVKERLQEIVKDKDVARYIL